MKTEQPEERLTCDGCRHFGWRISPNETTCVGQSHLWTCSVDRPSVDLCTHIVGLPKPARCERYETYTETK
jgi:hypothetical protein